MDIIHLQGLCRFYYPTSVQLARTKRTQRRSQKCEALGIGRRRWPLVWLWEDHHATVSPLRCPLPTSLPSLSNFSCLSSLDDAPANEMSELLTKARPLLTVPPPTRSFHLLFHDLRRRFEVAWSRSLTRRNILPPSAPPGMVVNLVTLRWRLGKVSR